MVKVVHVLELVLSIATLSLQFEVDTRRSFLSRSFIGRSLPQVCYSRRYGVEKCICISLQSSVITMNRDLVDPVVICNLQCGI